jgi:hypothetical protein
MGVIERASPVASSVSMSAPQMVTGPDAGVKRPEGMRVRKRWSGSAFSMPMIES